MERRIPRRGVRGATGLATLAALVALAASAPAPMAGAASRQGTETGSRPRPRPEPPGEGVPDPGRLLDIRFDLEVVERFLGFVDQGSPSRADLDSWSRLPGNRELLRQGRLEGGLSAEVLQEAARVTLGGGTFSGPPTLGRLDGGDWSTLRALVASLRGQESALRARVSRALDPYLPEGTLPPLVVNFHLGGSWDGRTSDAVYINLTWFQRRGASSLPGLEALLVHEVFHLAQGAMLPAIEDYGSRQSSLWTLLLRLEQEGIARHLEVACLEAQAAHTSLDATNLATYEDGQRRVAEHARLLADFMDALETRRMEEARRIAAQGFLAGGPFYAVGQAIARSIENGSGRAALAATVAGGPLAFARAYLAATGGDAPLFPPGMEPALAAIESGYGRDPLRASRRRREGLKLLMEERPRDAVQVLEEAVDLDPTDSASAYNLACAWSLLGKKKRSLRWLDEAFERGFTDAKHAANDPDLERLRDLPAFETLLRARGIDYRRPAHRARPPAGP